MKIEVISDLPVSPNLAAGNAGLVCAYPLTTVLADGSVAVVYRQGESKHSHDGIIVMQLSADGGQTWADPLTVFDGRQAHPMQTAVSAGLCQTADGALLVTFSTIEGLPSGLYMFSEEGERLPRHLCYSRSDDLGQTWSAPAHMELPGISKAGITTRPFVLPSGRVCMPIEYKTPLGPNGTAMAFSDDHGCTFGVPIVVATDAAGRLNLCDARFAQLPDGRVLSLLWTFEQASEETIEVHRACSSDQGKTWSPPEPIGFVGQITAPLALPTGEVIAASNYRHPPEGIRLWYSPDAGASWESGSAIQMWDLASGRVLAKPAAGSSERNAGENVWDALALFSFGTPDLALLEDGSILMTYYSTVDGIIHVRACRFRLQT